MNEITISKKKLFTWLLVIFWLAALGFGFYAFRRFLSRREATTQPAASLITLDDDRLAQAAARHGARMGSVAQQCSACYAISAASSAINNDSIVKQANIVILSPGGVAGSILTVRVSGSIPSFLGTLVPGLPGSFPVSAEATFRQEGW